jgi:Putative auto-transporter adhesin, head GIN domain
MKKLITMAVSLLTVTAASFAGTTNESKPAFTKVISTKAAFQHIVINGDVDVVLTEKDFVQVDVTGEQKSVEAVTHYVKRGTLYINRKGASKGAKPVVTIAVSDLQSLEVNGDGDVTSKGTLRSSKLKLTINGESKFNVRNLGEILLESDGDIDLQFEKSGAEEKPLTAITPDAAAVQVADAKMDEQFMKSVDASYCKN